MKRLVAALTAALCMAGLTSCGENEPVAAEKPIIYLYPEQESKVTTRLTYTGELTVTYPAYEDGWNVTAYPDGTLIAEDGKQYNYLFWEGTTDVEYDFSKGFCVAGKDTAEFLQQKLNEIGLEPKEYNEFIVYWLPRMQDNAYNLISFQSDRYTESAKLDIQPEPDSLLRVFMAWKPLDEPQEIEPQTFAPFHIFCGISY